MTDKMTFQIEFDHDLNVEIKSNSLSKEQKETLEDMINEREQSMDYTTLPELDHIIKSNSFGFEVDISTNEGKILEIVDEHIQTQKQLEEQVELEELYRFDRITEQLNKELDALSL